MEIDAIRELLAQELKYHEDWPQSLDDCNPGVYGVENWDVEIGKDNIGVDIPNRTFSFKDVEFDFEVLIGSSGSDGYAEKFHRTASGRGEFEFAEDKKNITIKKGMTIEVDLNLFG